MRLLLSSFTLFVITFFITFRASAQNLVPDTTSSDAVKTAYSLYNATLVEQLHIFDGKEYKDYLRPFEEGHPYFFTTTFTPGTVTYDGSTYANISVLYNVVTDELIILNNNKISKINLQKDKVNGFSLLNHSFINLTRDSLNTSAIAPGFYDVLVKGKTMLLAKRTGNIQSYASRTIEVKVYKKDIFYVYKNGSYSQISSKSALLNLLSDKRKEISQYMKHNGLRFGKNIENTLIATIEYYNQLTK